MHTPLIRSPSTNLLTNSAAFPDAFCKGEVVLYLLRLTEEEKLGSEGRGEGGGGGGGCFTRIQTGSAGHIRLNISNQDRFEGPKRVQLVETRPTGPPGVRFPQESGPKRPLAALIWHFLAHNRPYPPLWGGRANFHSFSPFLVLLSPPKGKKPVPLGPRTIFWGGYVPKFVPYPTLCDGHGQSHGEDRHRTSTGQALFLTPKFKKNHL